MEEIHASIHLCVRSIDRSISRGIIFTLGLDRKKPPRFHSLYRSSSVGKVIQGVEEQNNVQCSVFTPKRRKKFSF